MPCRGKVSFLVLSLHLAEMSVRLASTKLFDLLNLTEKIMSSATLGQIAGGWTPFSSDITKEASEVFEAAFKGFVGVSYSPVAFATQVVNGVNYSFFCNAKAVYPNAPNEAAIVNIYKPLDGPAHITEIRKIND